MQSNPMKCLSHLILCLCLLLPAIEANAIAPTIVMLSPDLPDDLRPLLTSTWITERTEAVNSYINDELSLKRNGFASSMAYKSGFQEKISSTPSLYSQTKPPIKYSLH